jgi:hypothetical protein
VAEAAAEPGVIDLAGARARRDEPPPPAPGAAAGPPSS